MRENPKQQKETPIQRHRNSVNYWRQLKKGHISKRQHSPNEKNKDERANKICHCICFYLLSVASVVLLHCASRLRFTCVSISFYQRGNWAYHFNDIFSRFVPQDDFRRIPFNERKLQNKSCRLRLFFTQFSLTHSLFLQCKRRWIDGVAVYRNPFHFHCIAFATKLFTIN